MNSGKIYGEIDVAPGWRDRGFVRKVLECFRDTYVDLLKREGIPVSGKLVVFVYDEGVDIVDNMNIPLPRGKEEEMTEVVGRMIGTLIETVKLLVGENKNEN